MSNDGLSQIRLHNFGFVYQFHHLLDDLSVEENISIPLSLKNELNSESKILVNKIMKELGGAKVIGPLLVGLGQAIEIAPLRSSTSDILNLASVAAYSSEIIDYNKMKKN